MLGFLLTGLVPIRDATFPLPACESGELKRVVFSHYPLSCDRTMTIASLDQCGSWGRERRAGRSEPSFAFIIPQTNFHGSSVRLILVFKFAHAGCLGN